MWFQMRISRVPSGGSDEGGPEIATDLEMLMSEPINNVTQMDVICGWMGSHSSLIS